MPETVNNDNVQLPSTPQLEGAKNELNSIAIDSIQSEPTYPKSFPSDITPPPPSSQKESVVALSIIGTAKAKIESALLDVILNMPRKSERTQEKERVEKREEKLDRRQARGVAADEAYFREIANEFKSNIIEAELVKDEVEFDAMLNEIIRDETFFNKMATLLSGRLERELTGRTEVTTDD